MLKVDEIFESIQGESTLVGYPTTFLRLYGCNINCSYCDTKQESYTEMTIEEVAQKIREFGNRYVCITGGEPLLQWEEVNELIRGFARSFNYTFSIETNGTIKIPEKRHFRTKFIMDIKMPSSNFYNLAQDTYKQSLENIGGDDEIKFVVQNEEDLLAFKDVMNDIKDYWKENKLNFMCPTIILSPVMSDQCDFCASTHFAQDCFDFIKKYEFDFVRIMLQQHKFMGVK